MKKKARDCWGKLVLIGLGNRKRRKRIKMIHRKFVKSAKFVNQIEPYRTLNLAYADSSSMSRMRAAEQAFHDAMLEIMKASKYCAVTSNISHKENGNEN